MNLILAALILLILLFTFITLAEDSKLTAAVYGMWAFLVVLSTLGYFLIGKLV